MSKRVPKSEKKQNKTNKQKKTHFCISEDEHSGLPLVADA